mmetsp:Transcript_17255/g.37228  ORF Transcript_17255/g.37228 Transcript_17255/m.37228 type:complete len:261 (+) Transcript_17255:298-1080(+)
MQSSQGGGLSCKDAALVKLYMTACKYEWGALPDLARAATQLAASPSELSGTVRHLIIFSGYAPCLAATISLRQAGLLEEPVPGKVGGGPGNAFELVYGNIAPLVQDKLHEYDPVLAHYIREHAYGDVYSSPGLSLLQKQMLAVAFLAYACMPDQLYTHLVAVMRFGATHAQCSEALDMGLAAAGADAGSPGSSVSPDALQHKQSCAHRSLEKAYAKFTKDSRDPNGGNAGLRLVSEPSVSLPDPECVRLPGPWPTHADAP